MLDNSSISTLSELGAAVKAARQSRRLTASAVAAQALRSRDILHRLERGDDVSARSLLDILRAIGVQIELKPARLPTLEEARARFAEEDDDDE